MDGTQNGKGEVWKRFFENSNSAAKYTILNFNDRLYLSVERYCTDLINGSLFRYIFFYRK